MDELGMLADQLAVVILGMGRRLRYTPKYGGMSALDMELLRRVEHFPGIGISEMARRAKVTPAAMSVHAKRLEAAGWIRRETDEPGGDRRKICLFLNDVGQREIARVVALRNNWLRECLAELSDAEKAILSISVLPFTRIIEMDPVGMP